MKIVLLLCFGVFLSFFFLGTPLSFAGDDITNTDFTINVGTMTPGGTALIKEGAGATVENFLTVALNKLIIIFGVLAVFIMTIGAGYMIIYHGQDEFLSKGKSIFMSGIISLAIALSAGVIVNLFAYLLY